MIRLRHDGRGHRHALAPAAFSAEADALTGYVLRLTNSYQPVASIDLHQGNLIDAG